MREMREMEDLLAEGDGGCDFCEFLFFYDQGVTCSACDLPGCLHCVTSSPAPLCPDCQADSFPRHIPPMLAQLSTLPADPEKWHFEYKWDGVRALAYWDGLRLVLESRNLRNITQRYPELEGLARKLNVREIILDGEILCLDRSGRPSFSLLQRRMHASPQQAKLLWREMPVRYFLFDVLFKDGQSLMQEPYIRRREVLEGLRLDHRFIRIPPSHPAAGEAMLAAAEEHGVEGILCKRSQSVYEPGRRSPNWRKVKILQTQEFVIGGWIPQQSSESRVGSLLLGYYTPDLRLIYAGSTGTGFSEVDHQILVPRMKELERPANPFATEVPKKEVRFLSPRLVAEVEYRRWPRGGYVQQASYKGLRTDKEADEVIRQEEENGG